MARGLISIGSGIITLILVLLGIYNLIVHRDIIYLGYFIIAIIPLVLYLKA